MLHPFFGLGPASSRMATRYIAHPFEPAKSTSHRRSRMRGASFAAAGKVLVRAAVLRHFRSGMTPDRRLGCLSIFLFVALCASLFVNFVLMLAAFQRLGRIREAEPIPRFREILLQEGE